MEELQINQVVRISGDPSPVIATAIHDGRFMRSEVKQLSALSDEERLREEDPFTAALIENFPARIVGLRSRFEFDLNRSPEQAVYKVPADAWGLNLWKSELSQAVLEENRSMYELAYNEIRPFIEDCIAHYGAVIVLDIHSYNHQREGEGIDASREENPDVNLGTANCNTGLWSEAIEVLKDRFSSGFAGNIHLDCRENIKFKGGYFSKWLNDQFGDKVCAVAVEFKKIFMNEWTGKLNEQMHRDLKEILESCMPQLMEVQKKIADKTGK